MIRRRLVVAVMVVVTAVTAVSGMLVVDSLRDRQIDAIDRQLRAMEQQTDRFLGTLQTYDRYPPLFEVLERYLPFVVRETAFVLVNPDGEVIWALPTGSEDAPDPLPDVEDLPEPGDIATVLAAGDPGSRFRIMTQEREGGSLLVIGVSLEVVDDTTGTITEILLITGAVALLAVAVAVWLVIRRGLRPLDQMIVTAGRIADGDLAQRASPATARGEVAELGGALNTMLDRIEVAMAARAASEEKMRRFLADASHELRTPLTSIRGYAELYRRGATDPDEVARGFDRIESQAERMGVLVDDLLLLARMDGGRPLDREEVAIAPLVTDAVADARALEPDRPLILDLGGDGSPAVIGDQSRLRRALDNLLANVRAHTEPGTRATVTVTATPDEVHIAVADDGPGMSAADADQAFERFYQADPHGPGAGLGLAIVAELVAAHEGAVHIDTTPAAGTTVTVVLPRAGSGTGAPSQAPAADTGGVTAASGDQSSDVTG